MTTTAETPLFLDDDDRILAFRHDRAKASAATRDDRVLLTSPNRDERLAAFEADKQRRIAEARQQRDDEIVVLEQERLARARASLAGLDDLGDIADEMRRAQSARSRLGLLRIFAFVLLPAALVLAYQTWVATPVYEATASIAVPASTGANAPAFLLQAIFTSPEMLDSAEETLGYMAQFSGPDMDPVYRARSIPWLGIDRLATFRRFVRTGLDLQQGMLTLHVRGRSPLAAEAAALGMVRIATLMIDQSGAKKSETEIIVPNPLDNPHASEIPVNSNIVKTYTLSVLFFAIVYAIFTIFIASFSHHATTRGFRYPE